MAYSKIYVKPSEECDNLECVALWESDDPVNPDHGLYDKRWLHPLTGELDGESNPNGHGGAFIAGSRKNMGVVYPVANTPKVQEVLGEKHPRLVLADPPVTRETDPATNSELKPIKSPGRPKGS